MSERLDTCTENEFSQDKKEETWPSPITKAPTPTEKSKRQRDNTKTLPTIMEDRARLRKVSLGNDTHQTGVVKPVYWIPTFVLTAKAM